MVLPQLRPALLGGMLLVALNLLGEFGAFTLLRFRTFTTELYAEYRTGFDGPESSLLAVVLLVLCLVCLALEFRVRSAGRYARVGGGAARPATPHALGWLAVPALAWVTALAVATLGVPLGMIAYWLNPARLGRDHALRRLGRTPARRHRRVALARGDGCGRDRGALASARLPGRPRRRPPGDPARARLLHDAGRARDRGWRSP